MPQHDNDNTHAARDTTETPQAWVRSTDARCKSCGYNLTGIILGENCPECRLPIVASHQYRTLKPTSAMAVTALLLGILGIMFLFLPVCGLLFPLVTLLAGYAALDEYREGKSNRVSFAFAITGLCLALLGIAAQSLIIYVMIKK